MPNKQRGQQGRRAPHQGRPLRTELALMNTFESLASTRFPPKVQRTLRNEMQQEPKTWRIFAQCREAYRAFSRWCSFKRKL